MGNLLLVFLSGLYPTPPLEVSVQKHLHAPLPNTCLSTSPIAIHQSRTRAVFISAINFHKEIMGNHSSVTHITDFQRGGDIMSAFGVAMACIGAPPIKPTATLDAAHRPSSIHQVIREDMRPVALQTTLSHLVKFHQGIKNNMETQDMRKYVKALLA